MPACYVLLAGLPGTGKSTLAEALASRLVDAVVLSKDEIRAAMFPGRAADYSDAQNELAITALFSAAGCLSHSLDGPRYVLIDGRTFSRAAHIERAIAEAEANGAAWRILHLVGDDATALARIAGASEHPAGDRDATLYWRVKQSFEPIVRAHLTIDTRCEMESCVEWAVRYLTASICA